jgi:hypothetical protein
VRPARSLGKQAHCPKSANVTTSLRLKLEGGSRRGGSVGRFTWSGVINHHVQCGEVGIRVQHQLAPSRWKWCKLTVRHGYLSFKFKRYNSHQTFNPSSPGRISSTPPISKTPARMVIPLSLSVSLTTQQLQQMKKARGGSHLAPARFTMQPRHAPQ